MTVVVQLTPAEYRLAFRHAELAAVGGVSRIHAESATRQEKLLEDQLVGQLGQVALHKYLYGHVREYALGRYFQNKYPTTGDQGEDIPGVNIDVKTSVMRYGQLPRNYKLWVRQREYHERWVYVLCMLGKDHAETRIAHLVGWCNSYDLLPDPDEDDRWVRTGDALYPLPPISYNLLPASHV